MNDANKAHNTGRYRSIGLARGGQGEQNRAEG